MDKIQSDVYTMNVGGGSDIAIQSGSSKIYNNNGSKYLNLSDNKIASYGCEDNILTGTWKTSITPDGFFIIGHENIYNDFKQIFNFENTYGHPKENAVITVDSIEDFEERLFEDQEATDMASRYINDCFFDGIHATDGDLVFFSLNDKNVKQNLYETPACALQLKNIFREPEIMPSMGKLSKNVWFYNCMKWDKIHIDAIRNPFDMICGFVIREITEQQFRLEQKRNENIGKFNNTKKEDKVFQWR